jgi:hypothetical protein
MRKWKMYLAFLAIFLSSSIAYADIYLEYEVANKNLPDVADTTITDKHYYTHKAMRVESSNGMIRITNFNTRKLYNLDTNTKTYTETDMNKSGLSDDFSAQTKEYLEKWTDNLKQQIQITSTNESKNIVGYDCVKYNVTFMGTNSEYWVSNSLKGYDEIEAIIRSMEKSLEKNPLMKEMTIMGLMDKMVGFPIRIVTHIMGYKGDGTEKDLSLEIGTTTATLRNIEQKDLSDELFIAPDGYTLLARYPDDAFPKQE